MIRKFEPSAVDEFVDFVLERTRHIFLEHFGTMIRDEARKASPQQSIHLELCVCPVGEDSGDIHNNCRLDLIVHDKDGRDRVVDLDYDVIVNFAPIQITRGSLTIHLSPFQWRSVRFEMQSEPGDLGPMQSWGKKWLLGQGTETSKPFEVANVIHSISRVKESEQGRPSFWVDFGSAPKEAFWELLDSLAASGITALSVTGDRSLILRE